MTELDRVSAAGAFFRTVQIAVEDIYALHGPPKTMRFENRGHDQNPCTPL